jgi:PrtD family type I secretion system ABC transporter
MHPFRRPVTQGLWRSRSALYGVAAFSAISNLLYLTGSFYMLEVYDRVLPSRSLPTLVALSLLAFMLYMFQGALEGIRGRLLARVGVALDQEVGADLVRRVIRLPVEDSAGRERLLPLHDLDQVRSFLSSPGPLALLDLPWMPLYLAICFAFHPVIGAIVLSGAILLTALAALTDVLTRRLSAEAVAYGQLRHMIIDDGRRSAGAVAAMAMGERLVDRWGEANRAYQSLLCRAADMSLTFGAMSKVIRITLQSAVLGIGAYLVIQEQATGGIMIAASILTARSLAPAELAIANWKSFVAARQSWGRLDTFFLAQNSKTRHAWLPRPRHWLTVENLSAGPPGLGRAGFVNGNFKLGAGQAMGVIGPSGSGKSTLARTLAGAWSPMEGKVKLDGAETAQWSAESLGRDIGYLPQETELLAGTIAENIARFDPAADQEAVIAAANAANAHEVIIELPEGYQTVLRENGAGVSAGQRQRIGLARALFGDPFLVVLDEPNSNLDAEGEAALTQAILDVRARGGICIVVSHRASVLAAVDVVAIVSEGRIHRLGARDDVLKHVLRPAPIVASPTAIAAVTSNTPSPPRLRELG